MHGIIRIILANNNTSSITQLGVYYYDYALFLSFLGDLRFCFVAWAWLEGPTIEITCAG
jgi:hypothetical protein